MEQILEQNLDTLHSSCTPEYQLISEVPAEDQLSWLDRENVNLEKLNNSAYAPMLSAWRENGVLILENFMPKSLREPYFKVRQELNKPAGWKDPCPYIEVPELRALAMYPELLFLMDELIGYEMGLHLNLTGWISSERAWHQDDYLNPDFVNSHYAAVWVALRDIDPNSGPFEFVPGSHRWPLTRRDKVLEHCPIKTSGDDPNWPTHTQDWVSDILSREIQHQGAKVEQFIAKEGDVLIWHGRLVHRGSLPKIAGTPRHSMIAHYSAIQKRPDMLIWKEGCMVPPGREKDWRA